MLWDASGITSFHIPEAEIPADLESNAPKPNTWKLDSERINGLNDWLGMAWKCGNVGCIDLDRSGHLRKMTQKNDGLPRKISAETMDFEWMFLSKFWGAYWPLRFYFKPANGVVSYLKSPWSPWTKERCMANGIHAI